MRVPHRSQDRFIPAEGRKGANVQAAPSRSCQAGPNGPHTRDVFLRTAFDQLWSAARNWDHLMERHGQKEVARNLGSLTWDWLKRSLPDSEEQPIHALRFLLTLFRDSSPESFEHSNRVAELARGLAEELHLDPEERRAVDQGFELREVGMAALDLSTLDEEQRKTLSRNIQSCSHLLTRSGALHDIGKLTVPDSILHKAGPLTDEERRLIELHPLIGETLLRPLPGMDLVLPAVRHHHERWDGTGYPDRLAGEEIPLVARILCLADSYDAMTGARAYREPLSKAEALMEILRNAGTQFDPELAGLFVTRLARLADAA